MWGDLSVNMVLYFIKNQLKYWKQLEIGPTDAQYHFFFKNPVFITKVIIPNGLFSEQLLFRKVILLLFRKVIISKYEILKHGLLE